MWIKKFISWWKKYIWLPEISFCGQKQMATSLIDAFKDADPETAAFLKDIKAEMNSTKKQFLVEVTTGEDTKMRPLKAGMEDALISEMAKSNPECSDWTVKSYYNRA